MRRAAAVQAASAKKRTSLGRWLETILHALPGSFGEPVSDGPLVLDAGLGRARLLIDGNTVEGEKFD
jgi:hypothetical protein